MGKRFWFMFICLMMTVTTWSQTSIRRILLPEGTVEYWPLLGQDTAVIKAGSPWSKGQSSITAQLPKLVHPDSQFRQSPFSKKHIARSQFDLNSFPVSTSLQLVKVVDGVALTICSGSMVGDRFALSAGHCILDFQDGSLLVDSLYVSVIRDQGQENPNFPLVQVTSVMTVHPFSLWGDDVMLLELEKPIGNKSGWLGMGFDKSDNKLKGRSMHKLSYPAAYEPHLDSQFYDGNDLFYSHGPMDAINSDFIGCEYCTAVPGESGSTLFTDSNYLAFGVLTYAFQMRHSRLQDYSFYSFRYAMQQLNKTLQAKEVERVKPVIYPNPIAAGQSLHIERIASQRIQGGRLYNMNGALIRSFEHDQFSTEGLKPGVYNLFLISSRGNYSYRLVVR